MQKVKKPSALYAKLVSFFKSKVTRTIIFSVLLVISAFLMLLLDQKNTIRDNYFSFLNDNFIHGLLDLFNIKPLELHFGTWLIYGAVFLVALTFLLFSLGSTKFVEARMAKNGAEDDASRKKYTLIYYLIPLCVSIALVFMFIMFFGGIGDFYVDVQVFLNIIYALLIALAFMVLVPVVIIVAYFVLRWTFWLLGAIAFIIFNFFKDIQVGNAKANEKAQKELKEIQNARNPGEPLNVTLSPTEVPDDKTYTNKNMFYALEAIDSEYENYIPKKADFNLTLEQFALQFQSYAINNHQIYYELPVVRSFIAGLATSRLIILEGLSGTGKSMLPRMFAEFTGCKTLFAPVQSTWRDKSDLLGYYSEFTKTFKVTDFLKRLYSANYYNDVNLMVLDEMNLSRIEYYFADFLSVLEYPKEDWLIKLIEPEEDQVLPNKLEGGYVRIPSNTYFIGTANTDDSTFTITDKVYDRAFVIDFKERFATIPSDYNSDPVNIDAETLSGLFESAINDENNRLTATEEEKFMKLCDFVRDNFDIRFGNRIMVQIRNFVPVYVAMGGKKEEALDIMFARKILRKLNGLFDDYIKDALVNFTKLLNSLYGKGMFTETEKFIDKLIKRLV